MTEEAKQRFSRNALIGLLSAGVGGASGVVGVSFSTGKAEQRLAAVEAEAQTARRERDELKRDIADIRAAQAAHQSQSDARMEEIKRRWEEGRHR